MSGELNGLNWNMDELVGKIMSDLRGAFAFDSARSTVAATASAALTRDFAAIRPKNEGATPASESDLKREPAVRSNEFSVDERLLVVDSVVRLAASTAAKRWLVRSNAVVTPAARDELKKRGVELIRVDKTSSGGANVENPTKSQYSSVRTSKRGVFLAIHLPNGGRFPKFVEDYLTRNFECDVVRLDCLKEATRQIVARIEKNRATRAVLATNDAAIASIWANRLSGVRAVVAFSAEQAKRDILATDANVVALSPADVAPYPFRQIVEYFLTR